MFTRLGRFTVRRRRLVLAFTALFVVVAAGLGTGVFGSLKAAGFDDPSSESSRAREVLVEELGAGDANLVVLATADDGTVDSVTSRDAGLALTARLAAEPGVARVASYWAAGNAPPLRSTDGTRAIVVARITGDEAEAAETYERLADAYKGDQGALDLRFGGVEAINADMGHTIERDLLRAEMISVPVTLALLVLVFGGLIAAGLPLFVALVAIFGTFLALFSIAQVTDVSIYSVNLTTALGLGLAIDYSLFIVSRFREELAAGRSVEDAVVRTVETAGRTVTFSAVTVAVSLAGLLVFPMYFLRSFAYAGAAVVVVAALGSVLSLPALLAVVGRRIDRFQVLKRKAPVAGADGFWHRLSTFVMRRPVGVGGAAVAVLLFLGLPFLDVNFGLPNATALPKGTESRVVSEELARDFDGNTGDAFAVVLGDLDQPATRTADIDAFATRVSALDGIARVTALSGTYVDGRRVAEPDAASADFDRPGGTWLAVTPSIGMVSSEGEDLVHQIRDLDAPFAFGVEGRGAELVDTKAAIFDRLPLALGIIAGVTFVLMFLVFGSLLVPLKAIVLNLLSLSATFGAMVWIFQQGNLADLLGITATGQLDVTMPILMFCIAFGLSMDYEVFLLSRIKEEYDLTGDNTHAVAMGLERTGRIVTAAAVLLAVTFVAFGTSGVSIIKLFGLGLALAIVMDATIIRGLLVPAFMRLAGDANWWAPAPLKRFQERWGISEGEHPRPEPELTGTGRH